jgi:hypothetical protein
MAGRASATAEIYAKFAIPTLPLGDDKRPLVGNFKTAELTMGQSRAFMRRRPDADVIGVPDGPLSGIVRLDIDERGDDVVREVIRRAGEPGAIARTASGKHHLLYADNGERRLTGRPGRSNARPWDDLKVDLCGRGGYSISPPSRFSDGSEYKFEGTVNLDELLSQRAFLPRIRGLPDRAYLRAADGSKATSSSFDAEPLEHMRQGSGRNEDLFRALLKAAHDLPLKMSAYMDWARECNSRYGRPMDDAEVIGIAKSVLGYAERGELRSGERGAWFGRSQVREFARDPYLFALIGLLKAENGPTSIFWVADGFANQNYLGWPRERLQRARRRAIDEGWIVEVRKPARGRAALYRWGPKASRAPT